MLGPGRSLTLAASLLGLPCIAGAAVRTARAQWEPEPPPLGTAADVPPAPPQGPPAPYPPTAYAPPAPSQLPAPQPAYPPPAPAYGAPAAYPGYETDQAVRRGGRPRTELWLSGLGTFGLAYGIPVLVVATTESSSDDVFFVPFVGPFVWLAQEADTLDSDAITWIVIDGILQIAGAVGFVAGLAATETYPASARAAPRPRWTASLGPRSLSLRASF